MEARLGHDFSRVRVHTDAPAAASARAVEALAYTVGKDVAFAAGRYRPGTAEGKSLLAHELTHAAQQAPWAGSEISVVRDGSAEAEATRAERAPGRLGGVTATAPGLARKPTTGGCPVGQWCPEFIGPDIFDTRTHCQSSAMPSGQFNVAGNLGPPFSQACNPRICAGVPQPIGFTFSVDADKTQRPADAMVSARIEFRPPAGAPATRILDESVLAAYAGPGAPMNAPFSVPVGWNIPFPFTPPGPGRIDIHLFMLEPTSSTSVVYDDSVPVVVCPEYTPPQPQSPPPPAPKQKIPVPTMVVHTGRWVFVEDPSRPQDYRLIRGKSDPAWDRPDRIAEILFDATGRYFWFDGLQIYLHGGAQ
jgi:hypothetical protein